jgi:uncharacterized SAM-binding protein YcdF (DUF218 family)
MKNSVRGIGALLAAALVVSLVSFGAAAGRMLVVNAPRSSDVILVLAGETSARPARALELLQQGYSHKVILDVPADARIYDFTDLQLARMYVQRLPEAASIKLCPIHGLSTKEEAHDAAQCLAQEGAQSVLIVTSDFHTRRALNIFRHELRGKVFSVAASYDDVQFGTRWWQHRQWAKTGVDEWLRLVWWEAIEQWN